MSAGWKTLDTPNSSLTIDPIERRPGRLLKRLLEGYNRQAQTGHLLAEEEEEEEEVTAYFTAQHYRKSH